MTKEERYQASAEELLRLVGGRENIISAAHCATRLRLVLKDEEKADVDGILKVDLGMEHFGDYNRKGRISGNRSSGSGCFLYSFVCREKAA